MVARKAGKSSVPVKSLVLKKKGKQPVKRLRKDVRSKGNEKPSIQIKSMALEKKRKEDVKPTNEEDFEKWWKDAEKYISDGRIFEADREMVLSKDEEDEKKIFKTTLKLYHDISRKLRRNAYEQELRELRKGKKVGHFEGNVANRIRALKEGERILDNAEIIGALRLKE